MEINNKFMGFTTACFIRKNTPELRKKVEELGYYRHPSYVDNGQYLYLNRGFYHTNVIGYSEEIERMIDCVANEELFLALAALRDDTDKYQQFVCIESYCDYFDLFHDIGHFAKCITDRMPDSKYWRKATAEEIIEHFKR